MQAYILDGEEGTTFAGIDCERQIARTRSHVYKLVYHMLGNANDAEDVTQETLLRAWSRYSTYDPTRSFDAWICRIAQNLCIDHIRHRRRFRMLSLDTPTQAEAGRIKLADHSQDPEALLLARAMDSDLDSSLSSLSGPARDCVLLLQRGYSYEEISVLLDCPIGTIRSRLHRARSRIRKVLSVRGAAERQAGSGSASSRSARREKPA